MTTLAPPDEARSIQELIDAASSSAHAVQKAQAQFITPPKWAAFFQKLLPIGGRNIFDPQCGDGNLVTTNDWRYTSFGFEIDNRMKGWQPNHRLTGNCVKAWELLDDLYPDLRFQAQVANPPFGIRWRLPDGKTADSVGYTWKKITDRAAKEGYGYFIAAKRDIEKLAIHKHQWAYLYQTFPSGMFDNVDVEIGVVHWQNKPALERPTYQQLDYQTLDQLEHDVALSTVREFYKTNLPTFVENQHHQAPVIAAFNNIQAALDEEKLSRPDFNIWLSANGMLRTYLSTRFKIKNQVEVAEIVRLSRLNNQHPLTLTTDRETRKLLSHFVERGIYTIQPEAKAAIESALREVESLSCPIMPVTDFETVAYADEEDHLTCKTHETGLPFTPGKKYELSTSTYNFSQRYSRERIHYNEEENRTYTKTHECFLSGKDRLIQIFDDNGQVHHFKDKPNKDDKAEHDESVLWKIFERPIVKTVAETCADKVASNKELLNTCELLSDFKYYPGQLEYLARVAVKDNGLIAADVGCGKTLVALSLIQIKAPKRALIIAPQGTLRGGEFDDDEDEQEYQASQWVQEIRRFAPGIPVFQLFAYEDYERICAENGGKLPEGIFISYYQAMFSNGARERAPETWDDVRLAKECAMPVPPPPDHSFRPKEHWARTVGEERNGIRCIIAPCMATSIGDNFDMVCLDEAHICCNLDANVTQMLLRMQPKYRYAFTATPIPNIVTNLFSLMGWLCVPEWYKGNRRNAAWPYSREESHSFSQTFLSSERDLTQESINRKKDKQWRGKCEKTSPIISSPARLLKLLRPTLAFISKEACNPNLVKREVIDVRVPMGAQQSKLYGHFLDRANIKAKNPLVRARKQVAYLRNICADPSGFTHGGPKVDSNFNPKTVAILELVREILARKEQAVIVSARIGQSNTIYEKLVEAGVKVARIDSTTPAARHSAESNKFKSKKAQVMILGIKCAMGHSYDDCQNLIIASLEYSYGSKHQAEGRIWRVNSKKDVRVYCILHKLSIEETMFDVVSQKMDAATICLYGQRIPRDYHPVEMGEVIAKAFLAYRDEGTNESKCEEQWPKLQTAIKALTI